MQRVVIKNRCSLSHMRRSLSMSAYSFDAEGKKTTRLREMFEKKDLAFLMYADSRAAFFFFFQFILRYLSIDVLWIYDLDTYLDLHTLLFTKKNNLERHVLRRKIWPINDYTYSLHNVFLSFNILYYDTSQLSWYRFIIWTQITKYTITHVYPNNTGKHITVSRQRLWRKRDFRESGRADSRLVRRSEWETVTKRLGLKY